MNTADRYETCDQKTLASCVVTDDSMVRKKAQNDMERLSMPNSEEPMMDFRCQANMAIKNATTAVKM